MIAFFGGMTIQVTASLSDFQCFFQTLDYMVAIRRETCPVSTWDLIRKSLYRRYLRPDQLEDALTQMHDIRDYLKTQDRDFIGWSQIGPDSPTVLNPNQPTMADIFSVIFEKFEDAVSESKYMRQQGLAYGQVRIIIGSPVVRASIEAGRELKEFDALTEDATPFWAVPDPPNQLSHEEGLALGILGGWGPYSDELIQKWAKKKIMTADAKRRAANDATNRLTAPQRQFLLEQADIQEAKRRVIPKPSSLN